MHIKKKFDATDKVLLATMACMLIIMVLRCAGVHIAMVRGSSMSPTICEGELVIGLTVKDTSSLQRGDVITLHPVHSTAITYIKRIVAMSGDIVETHDDTLIINGKESEFSLSGTGTWGPSIVGSGCVFVLGDNRFHSIDSRIFGPVPMEQIVARIIA